MEGSNKPNKGIENAFKAGVWYSISAIIAKSISIITTPFFTRMMSTSDYGIAATFSSWYSILLIICTVNLSYSHSRAKIDFPGHFEEYVGSTHTLSYLVTSVLFLLSVIFIGPISNLLDMNNALVIILFFYLYSGGTVLLRQSENRYKYDYKKNILITLFIAFGTAAFTFLFLFTLNHEKYYAKILGFVVPSVLLGIIIIVKKLRTHTINFNREYWKYGLRISAPLVLHTISLNILTQSDRIVINKFCGSDDAGIYSLVYQYAMLVNIVLLAINESWNPWFHDTYHEGASKYELINKNIIPVNALVGYVCIGCIAIGPEAVLVLGSEKYLAGVYCIIPIVLGLMAQFLFSHYIILEVHHKRTEFTSIGTVVAAVLNIALNLIFVPMFGFVAAACTTLASYLVLYLIHLYIVRRKLNIQLYNDWRIFSWFLIVAVASVAFNFLYNMIIPRYLLMIGITVVMLLIFRKELLAIIEERKRNKGNG